MIVVLRYAILCVTVILVSDSLRVDVTRHEKRRRILEHVSASFQARVSCTCRYWTRVIQTSDRQVRFTGIQFAVVCRTALIVPPVTLFVFHGL